MIGGLHFDCTGNKRKVFSDSIQLVDVPKYRSDTGHSASSDYDLHEDGWTEIGISLRLRMQWIWNMLFANN